MSLRTGTVTVVAAIVVLIGLIVRQAASSDSSVMNRNMAPSTSNSTDDMANREATPVLVELFTSEGCSSCPPADALLMRLGRTQPVRGANVIVLEAHVDYWDSLGWKDPFSSESATARQGEYSEAFGGNQVYTPQMIVDGHAQFVGNSESDALRAIRAAMESPKPAAHLEWKDGDMLSIHVDPLANVAHGDVQQIYVAVTESKLHSDVKRGENAGRALEHDGVVRQLLPLGKIDNPSSEFTSTVTVRPATGWNRANLRAVVFVQGRTSRRVVAASDSDFPAT